jgi:hypothetical protein
MHKLFAMIADDNQDNNLSSESESLVVSWDPRLTIEPTL